MPYRYSNDHHSMLVDTVIDYDPMMMILLYVYASINTVPTAVSLLVTCGSKDIRLC